jgi:c(7)-type cytochrome triheme protein
MRKLWLALGLIIGLGGMGLLVSSGPTIAGFYADMVLNSKAEKRGMPPVVFPHWLHRIEFKCKVCHPAIFEMRSGSNDIDMNKIISGQFCGKCHNGTISWKPVQCARCHSGQPGLTTGPLLGVK